MPVVLPYCTSRVGNPNQNFEGHHWSNGHLKPGQYRNP